MLNHTLSMRHQQIFLSGLKDADSRPHQPIGSAIDWSPLSECGDLSGLRRRLSARDIESFPRMRSAFILPQLLGADLAGYGQDRL